MSMRRLLTTLLTLLLTVPVLVLTAPAAQACSCAQGSLEQHLADSDLVVEGTVTSVRTTGRERAYTFEVQRSWKGPRRDVVTVRTRVDGAECGRTYAGGRPQVVLAVGSDGTWRTDLCRGKVFDGGTQIRDVTAAQVEEELGRGTRSGDDVTEPTGDDAVSVGDPSPWPGIAVGTALLVLLVVGRAVLGRRGGER
ncbi:MAG: hypothetical protein C0493_12080 [Kytococcus sp.]|nr:hypothetical protein [Kytococcus sp.]